jgi:hypothetical protein
MATEMDELLAGVTVASVTGQWIILKLQLTSSLT